MTNQRRAIILIILAGVLLVGFLAYSLGQRAGKTAVELEVVGKNVTVKADGKSVNGTAYLKPGPHTITAEAEGFNSIKKDIVVGENQAKVTLILDPKSDDAKKWAKEHEKDYSRAEGQAGELTRAEGEAFIDSYPLTNYLPEKTSYYSIDYRINDKNQAVIIISSTSALGRQVALEKIRSFGFDPTDYIITFTGFEPALKPVEQINE